jgi:hypothetical protein
MKLHLVAVAAPVALGLAAGACNITSVDPMGMAGTGTSGGTVGVSGSGSGGSGGTGNTAGGSGGSAPASCSNVAPCGGNVVGTWKVASSCLSVSGSVDIGGLGLGCTMATATGSMQVTGSFTANPDGSYTDNTTTTGTEQLELAAACLVISGTTTDCAGVEGPLSAIGYSSVTCTPSASGGCSCMASVNKPGGIGVVTADSPKMGNYKTAGNVLTNDEARAYPYCVSGGTMTWTPQTATPITTGSIVFQSDSGSGGAGGSGGSGGTGGSGVGGSGGSGGSGMTAPTEGPCDVYAAGNTPCVAAYSTIRRLSKTYTGPLYQVRNGSSAMNTGSGGMTKDIGVTAEGFADTATQDAFCAGSVCTFSLLYDQSGKKNNLKVAPKGLSNGGMYAAMDDFESSATKGSMMVAGHKVYSLYMAAREGYRLTAKGDGMPLGTAAQGIYILADGTHSGTACCWDFGNVSTDPTRYGVMNTIFFGTGFWGKGAGQGPWFLGDFEGGVWAGGSGGSNVTNNNNPSLKVPFALGMLKTSPNHYALRMANLQMAADLTTAYDGQSPKQWANDGGIVLGVGGDNSNNSWGTFFEGAIVAGAPTNDTDLAVMKNVQAVGYGK